MSFTKTAESPFMIRFVERFLDDRGGRIHVAAVLSMGLAPRLESERPLVELFASLAEGVLLSLARSGDEPVQ